MPGTLTSCAAGYWCSLPSSPCSVPGARALRAVRAPPRPPNDRFPPVPTRRRSPRWSARTKRKRTSPRRWARRQRCRNRPGSDHLYSCRYGYPAGSFALSVKELSSWAQTYAYFRMPGTQLGKTRDAAGARSGGVPDHRRISGRAQGLEGPVGGLLEPSGPIRRTADQLGGRGGHRCRRDPRVLGWGLTASVVRRPCRWWTPSGPGPGTSRRRNRRPR